MEDASAKHHLLLSSPLPFTRGHACFHLDISVNKLAWHLGPAEASVWQGGREGGEWTGEGHTTCLHSSAHVRQGAAGGNDRERYS